ncbi:Fe(3+)-hydroxamate ABC transporter permease FhuB [Kushneria phosphatilytica]|uniref:Fe(3+)-hydroxamate ABC transporter permease FhuB n=1 Tax=Kushneria phosphatilytica TaxID=657387 RepID=A0A1S1NYF8_9GAMM|nr:Fe(3+)-hydroxamate ABC transporter permease FhuB [Kushneria phosphatilytica]OHV12782.1 Fe3+-hydroxamate ABC transporter permease FhuB [Kushneria phosphatilytica]QEL10631.1 Fe(3+)-hydroxamate ABC transporter permease FhuB [Kushneria phosphatilytica]
MRQRRVTPGHLCSVLALACVVMIVYRLHQLLPANQWLSALTSPRDEAIEQVVVHFSLLPRICVALLGGAALGLAGTLMQQVLKNPLASPTTLGVANGAQLALVAASLWAPGWLIIGREWVALLGGGLATALVFALAWRRGLAPMAIVLAGLVVSLYLSAINSTLMLFYPERLRDLFIWNAGSLIQNGWGATQFLLLRLALAGGVMLLLLRPLALLDFDDQGARNLGVSLRQLRFVTLAIAVFMTGCVVSQVGIIGFIGLASPAIVRLLGARRLSHRLRWAPVLGALLLLATDLLLQFGSGPLATLLPTGAATAALGAPLLLWLIPRLSLQGDRAPSAPMAYLYRHPAPKRLLMLLGLALLLGVVIALSLSQGREGWHWPAPGNLMDAWPWRAPRVAAAAASGLMLALAGTILQRITGNPIASPEVLGISAGAAIGVLGVIMLTPLASQGASLLFGTLGALLTLGLLVLLNRRNGLAPQRLLLSGVAITALFDALQRLALSGNSPRTQKLLAWISGSTYYVDGTTALIALAAAAVLLIATLPFHRWLDLLPLGEDSAHALGINVRFSRILLLALMAVMTAGATLVVGPLSFIGLMAPHMARLVGLPDARSHLLGAGLIGMLIMVLADWLGRIVAFPDQIPAGLVASLIGGAWFMWGLRRL